MKLPMFAKVFCLALLTCLCVACGPNNTVPLTYPTKDTSVLPSPSAPRIAVVIFDDKRTQSHLGQRDEESTFVGTTSVTDWTSRSFAEALRDRGMQVSLANTLQEAQASGMAYIITGAVTEAMLNKTSIAGLSATMQASFSVRDANGIILTENLAASQSTTGLITTGAASEIMQSTVQELIRPGVDKVAQAVGVY